MLVLNAALLITFGSANLPARLFRRSLAHRKVGDCLYSFPAGRVLLVAIASGKDAASHQ